MSRMRLSLMQRLSFLIRVFGIGCSGRCLPRRICGLRRALLHAVLFGQRLLATTLVDALLQQIACAQPQANGFLEGASPDAVAAATGSAFGAAQG